MTKHFNLWENIQQQWGKCDVQAPIFAFYMNGGAGGGVMIGVVKMGLKVGQLLGNIIAIDVNEDPNVDGKD